MLELAKVLGALLSPVKALEHCLQEHSSNNLRGGDGKNIKNQSVTLGDSDEEVNTTP